MTQIFNSPADEPLVDLKSDPEESDLPELPTHPPLTFRIYVEAVVLLHEGQADYLDVFRSLGQSQRLLLLN